MLRYWEQEDILQHSKEEKALVNFDVEKFKADSISKKELSGNDVSGSQDIQFTLATLPTYYFEGKPFLLMEDIQMVFDMREDQCLGCFAQYSEVDSGFVDFEDNCPLNVLDAGDTNFVPKENVGTIILPICAEYEQGLPTEEEFDALQEKLDLHKMGREQGKEKDEEPKTLQRSIDIYDEKLLDYDESRKVYPSSVPSIN